ncbi:ParA family protein [Brucella rhizosphaerae]|uniref:CobQ/CobB/MinD/ParA nucleotide binding domain protein n=2 Tax=Brucella rhizosphaerae TaxID=571254 RepID=A0A256FXP1_9HYPH|nr:ParA family protein [Brucella rhizosphaerae]OYR19615.1 cobQ/CobB/MinD/ParA nucleotide binding domain protein [Brucella rhizosphaerae]
MLKIALVGQKGGVGKSTLSWLLINAVLTLPDKTTVLLIETDSQGSSAMFHRRVIGKYPALAARFTCFTCLNEHTLLAAFEQAESAQLDYVIIDTAGRHEDMTRFVLTAADRVVVPFRPSVKEYESQLATVGLYKQLRSALEANGETAPKAVLLLNDWTQNARLTTKQKSILNAIYEEEMLASFYVPARNGFDTLDQGTIFLHELQEEHVMRNAFVKTALEADLQTAISTLKNIEAMQ